MKHDKTRITAIFAVVCTLILIFDSQTAVRAAAESAELCIDVVVPSLFPLFFFSVLLTGSLSNGGFSILKPLRSFLGLSDNCDCLLLTGFLGGYPAGAQSIAQAYKSGNLTKKEAERMLAYCSNAGPSFIFGIAGGLFSNKAAPWLLWLVQILSAICVGMLYPSEDTGKSNEMSNGTVSLSEALSKSIKAIACVCGWILLFRCLLAFCEKWFLCELPQGLQTVFSGLLELTNGCWSLRSISSEQLRFILCAVFLSFGGLCVLMQTKSVTGDLRLSFYIRGKLLQSGFSAVFSLGVSNMIYSQRMTDPLFSIISWIAVVSVLLFIIHTQKAKKAVAFQRIRVYNNQKIYKEKLYAVSEKDETCM